MQSDSIYSLFSVVVCVSACIENKKNPDKCLKQFFLVSSMVLVYFKNILMYCINFVQ